MSAGIAVMYYGYLKTIQPTSSATDRYVPTMTPVTVEG
jgi:hypothetical protein